MLNWYHVNDHDDDDCGHVYARVCGYVCHDDDGVRACDYDCGRGHDGDGHDGGHHDYVNQVLSLPYHYHSIQFPIDHYFFQFG